MDKKSENSTNQAISLMFSVNRIIKERGGSGSTKSFSRLNLETLRYIKEKQPLMKEVADYLCVTPPSATALINNLVEQNLVERVADKEDRRIVRLDITQHGKKELKDGIDELAGRMKKILSFLDDKEKENLIKILEKISTNN
ncbi:MAG TPA: MarR family transcriptional regulator [Patescibacteria group bacterium]